MFSCFVHAYSYSYSFISKMTLTAALLCTPSRVPYFSFLVSDLWSKGDCWGFAPHFYSEIKVDFETLHMLSVQLLTQINAEAHALMSTLSHGLQTPGISQETLILSLSKLDCCSLQDKKAKTCHLSVIKCFDMKKIIVVFPESVLSEAKHLLFSYSAGSITLSFLT